VATFLLIILGYDDKKGIDGTSRILVIFFLLDE